MPPTAEENAIKIAVLEDRQSDMRRRQDDFALTVIAKLESIGRDVSAMSDSHHRDIEALHDRISREKQAAHDDLWAEIRRHQDWSQKVIESSTKRWDEFARDTNAKIDQGRLLTITSLTAAVVSLIGVVATAALHVGK